ncbi:MAG: precorrin-4 C(11)-methyltransferase [Spirochaetaceae bacterium]|nr:precorrin-4 C(11)-methyltransferase [Spirochaetaceae bacterium]
MIYFVGAGPGAVDLITVRGKALISEADQIIYAGSLVNPALLAWAKPECALYNSASMTLEEVIGRFVEGEQKGWRTVRLHTGDPSIYGAVREQMDALAALGAAFEVVPGVSAFCAAAASLRAEYTLPAVSQTLIITRAAGRTSVPEKEDLAALAAHQASMAVFLSADMVEDVRDRLLAGGYPPDTPAAIVYKASWPEEKITQGALKDLCALGEGITKTALILVGSFLGGKYGLSRLYDPSFTHGFRP